MIYQEKKQRFSAKTALLIGIVIVVLGAATLILKNNTNATPVVGFSAGNIMDDAVFVNKNTMSVQQIQAFLNSKVPVCDTMGTRVSEFGGGTRAQWAAVRGYAPPFTCLKDFSEGGKTSAQIIYDAAQEFSINPQVLIVLLQKEQGLVTDTWPIPGSSQYRTATGYGCPDTAPCDSQYYGLTNQLRWSARMFRAIMNASPTWFTPYIIGNNYIQYSPVSSCGGTNVVIENRATQALYNYTPYQPNPAAIAAGWGQAPCGAYGNRNFYLYFTEWFGRTSYLFGNTPAHLTAYASAPCTIPMFNTTQVSRLYQPDTQDYLFTTSRQESCAALKLGYIWDGIVFRNEGPLATDSTPVYRLNLGSSHFYTASLVERNTLIGYGYVDEGISFYGLSRQTGNSIPAYQLTLYGGIPQFMTSAGAEGSYFVESLGYSSEGIAFYTTPLADQTSTPLFRLRSVNDRLYTASQAEANAATSLYGYTAEGTALKVDAAPGIHSRPVYRLMGPGGRVYTTDRNERDRAITDFAYVSEGTGFYSYSRNLALASPVYRSTNYTQKTRLYTSYIEEHFDSRTFYGYTTQGISWYGLP